MTSLTESRSNLAWHMLFWLLATQVLVAFVGRSVAPLGVLIGQDLSLTKAQVGMLPAALFLGQSIASIPVGYWVDKVGSKKLLLMLTSCLALGFILASISTNFTLLLVLVTLGGIGYGSMHPTSNRGIMNWFEKRKRGTAMGIKQMGVTLGSALAALLLLPLAAHIGWRLALSLACVLLFITGLLAFIFYKDPPQENMDQAEEKDAFLTTMKKFVKHKPLLLLSISAMGLTGAQMSLTTYLVLFAYEKLGISLFLSGLLLVISEVSGSVGRVVWGLASDRLFAGRRIVILMIIALMTGASSLVVAFLQEGTSFFWMVPITVIFGFSVSGFNGMWMNAATELVPAHQSGLASGFSLTVGSWGVILGPPLFGLMIDQTGLYLAGWLSLVLLMVIVLLLLWWLQRILKEDGV